MFNFENYKLFSASGNLIKRSIKQKVKNIFYVVPYYIHIQTYFCKLHPTVSVFPCRLCLSVCPNTNLAVCQALDVYWHEDCLKCGCCDCRLGEVGHSLYTKVRYYDLYAQV